MSGETLFGIQGKGFAILAADQHMAFSIIQTKDDEDKIKLLDSHKMIACQGPCADRSMFIEYISKNVTLNKLRTGVSDSTKSLAFWTRNELATALRSRGAYQTDLLIAGYDAEEDAASLYYIDYLSACQKLAKGAHGYGAYFCNGLMDRYWTPDMTLDDGLKIIARCINELQVRFVGKMTKFMIKVVTKDGIRIVSQADLPKLD